VNHSLQLDKRLSRITWVTVLLVVTVFLIAFWFVLYDEQKKSVVAEEAFLSQVMDAQEMGLQQEMFLNLEDAVQLRLDGIVRNNRLKAADMRACIRLTALKSGSTGVISSCTDPADQAEFDNPNHRYKERILSIGVEPTARIRYFLLKDRSLDDFFPPKVLFAILFAAVGAFFLHRHAVKNLQKNVVRPLLRKIAQDERNAAIAKTMQMVTHDVRKPFLALRTIIESLISADGKADPQALRTKVLPTLDQSIATVDSMLSDVLELGTTRELQPEDSSLTEAFASALHTLLPLFPRLRIHLSYDFEHRRLVRADAKHLSRVISNLVENAFQAVDSGGRIWVRTRRISQSGDRFVEVTVGNTGSFIEESNLERIFDPFVTTKRSGYGLGLAIASKFVADYGGKIWASSSPDSGTEFHFALPISVKHERVSHAELPKIIDPGSPELTREFLARSSDNRILVFDDENCIREAWSLCAERSGITNLTYYSSWEDFIDKDAFELVEGAIAFVDINFKNSRFNGLDIAGQLRKLGVTKLYAITADPKTAQESGLFDEVLGKKFPNHLIKTS
jgi:signal transduction histidine kinase